MGKYKKPDHYINYRMWKDRCEEIAGRKLSDKEMQEISDNEEKDEEEEGLGRKLSWKEFKEIKDKREKEAEEEWEKDEKDDVEKHIIGMSPVIKIADSLVDQYLGSLTKVLIPEVCAKNNIKIPEGKFQPEGFWTHNYIIGFFTSHVALHSQTLNLFEDFGIGRIFNDEDNRQLMNRVLDKICPDEKEQFMLKNLEIDKKLKETGDPNTAYDKDYKRANSDVSKSWILHYEGVPIRIKQFLKMPEITPELLDEPYIKLAKEKAVATEVKSADGNPLSLYVKMGLILSDTYIKEHIYLQYIKK